MHLAGCLIWPDRTDTDDPFLLRREIRCFATKTKSRTKACSARLIDRGKAQQQRTKENSGKRKRSFFSQIAHAPFLYIIANSRIPKKM